MSRATLPPERILDLLPEPIIDLARELAAADEGSSDYAKLTEVFRGMSIEANAVLYRISANPSARNCQQMLSKVKPTISMRRATSLSIWKSACRAKRTPTCKGQV